MVLRASVLVCIALCGCAATKHGGTTGAGPGRSVGTDGNEQPANAARRARGARSGDRSRQPIAPAAMNDAALVTHYPQAAHRAQLAGTARVMVDLSAAGEITSLVIVEETPVGHGFGEACREALGANASGWSAARDASGTNAPSRFVYVCEFGFRTPDASE